MDYRKKILGAASILALATGVQAPAQASAQVGSIENSSPKSSVPRIATMGSEHVFDLLVRSKGDLSASSIEKNLLDMFAEAKSEQVVTFPAFMKEISKLGLTSDASAKAREILSEIVVTATIDEDQKSSITEEISNGLKPMQLAQRRTRDPDVVGQVGGGTGGGAAGGGYQ